jgi:hypothetical protein
MTLKEHLKENGITLEDRKRKILGKRIASIWNCRKMGSKHYLIEDEREVIDYPIKFLKETAVERNIIRFLKLN